MRGRLADPHSDRSTRVLREAPPLVLRLASWLRRIVRAAP
jgi:hypothetical protein